VGPLAIRYLTISVDDGHPSDLRTAELLDRFGLRATFYVPARNPERAVMAPHEVRALAQRFEIGGHTFNHLPLRGRDRAAVRREVRDGKAWCEDVTGEDGVAFCYPQGKFDALAMREVAAAGYCGARTCMLNRTDVSSRPFAWGVTTQAFPHSVGTQLRHALVEANLVGAWNFLAVHAGAESWPLHFERAVERVAGRGGVAHLYLHSWEIDALGQWHALSRLLERLAERDDFVRVTNGELFKQHQVGAARDEHASLTHDHGGT
jgi:peptidoglycan-N-acetylglucosamine deacetylase